MGNFFAVAARARRKAEFDEPIMQVGQPAGRDRSRGDLGAGARGEGRVVSAFVHAVRGRGRWRRVRRRLPLDQRAQAEELVGGAGQAQRARGVVVAVGVARGLQQAAEQRVVQVRDGDDEPLGAAVALRRPDAHRQPPSLHLPLLLLGVQHGSHDDLSLLAPILQPAETTIDTPFGRRPCTYARGGRLLGLLSSQAARDRCSAGPSTAFALERPVWCEVFRGTRGG
jgi:hypothetical protein